VSLALLTTICTSKGFGLTGISVLGRRADIPRLVERYDVGLIFFAIHNITTADRGSLLDICTAHPLAWLGFLISWAH